MHLVKWLRKNNAKIMAVVVIVIMLGFIGGTYIQQLARRSTGLGRTVARFGNNRKITNRDLFSARTELELLKMLGINMLLKSQDIRTILLGELLFADRSSSPELAARLKQAVIMNNYNISDSQLNDIYNRSMSSEVYWLLLKAEAEQAAIMVPNQTAGEVLGQVIPMLSGGATYKQVIQATSNQLAVPEEDILETFGKLIAVMSYAHAICAGENITLAQIMHRASWQNETIDTEFVQFDSAVFAETQQMPTDRQLTEHFEKYKKFLAGEPSTENPYGFGYKLPDKVALEYVILRLDDVSNTVTAPTPEETEEYYQKHTDQFTESILSDPNDPNSEPLEQTKGYAEVAGLISEQLLLSKTNLAAENILQELKTLTESALQTTDTDPQNLTDEQRRQLAGDYKSAAEQLSKKHNLPIYTGQTGLLSAMDAQMDEQLGTLYLRGYGYNPVSLLRVIFAIDRLGASTLGPFDVQSPRMYENIGPLKDVFGRTTALVRITDTAKTAEPNSIEQTYNNTPSILSQDWPQQQSIHSVKQKVTEDLKRLAAMNTVKERAGQFIALAAEDGTDSAIDTFNNRYGQQDNRDPDSPETFRLQSLTNLQRIPPEAIETLTVQRQGSPAAQSLINEQKKQSLFINRLYDLVPQDTNTVEALPRLMLFEPDMSWYCLNKLFVKRLTRQQYEQIKAAQAYRDEQTQSQSLAAIHFNPQNILKRMNFKPTQQPAPAQTAPPQETEDQL